MPIVESGAPADLGRRGRWHPAGARPCAGVRWGSLRSASIADGSRPSSEPAKISSRSISWAILRRKAGYPGTIRLFRGGSRGSVPKRADPSGGRGRGGDLGATHMRRADRAAGARRAVGTTARAARQAGSTPQSQPDLRCGHSPVVASQDAPLVDELDRIDRLMARSARGRRGCRQPPDQPRGRLQRTPNDVCAVVAVRRTSQELRCGLHGTCLSRNPAGGFGLVSRRDIDDRRRAPVLPLPIVTRLPSGQPRSPGQPAKDVAASPVAACSRRCRRPGR